MTNTEKLTHILTQNPNLPVVFFTSGEDLDEYYYTFRTEYRAEVGSVWQINDMVYDSKEEAIEIMSEILASEKYEEYKELSNEEFAKIVEEEVELLPHYDAIIIWVYN